jgi:predicted AAA+ superfamily ATPase
MSNNPKPWIESVHLHPDVLKENAETDIFALDLGPLADGSGTVAPVYRDAESFFRASYVTAGLKSLLDEVLKRLAGKGGAPVLKLMTPFGGGKSHTMAALFHAANSRKALDVLPEAKGLESPTGVRVAVVDGQFFNAQQGKESQGIRPLTLWGWLALQLGGKAGYETMRANDEARVSPGGDDLVKLFGDKPNLILLDETLEYLINAGGVKVLNTDLREQTLNFLKELTVAAANAPRTVVLLALPSSQPSETLQHGQLLQTLDHFVGRKDTLREPVEQDEVFKVIQRRLLEKMPDDAVAGAAASAFQQIFTQMRKAYAGNAAEEQQAAEEGIQLRDRMRLAYPFHPALLDLMRQRWASLPEYQRTRGALRFLAACLRAQHKAGKSGVVLGPGDVLLSDPEVRRACIKELSLMNRYDAVFQADLVGPNSRAGQIDKLRAKSNPAEVGKGFASRLATAIFLYSFGGLRREGENTKEVLPPGVSESDLLSACVGPDLDSLTAQACLAELRRACLYLHFDGVRYCFKQDPNVTLLIEQEADAVARDDASVTAKIKEMLEERLAGHHAAIAWPVASGEIPDEEPRFQIAYLPLDFATKPPSEKETTAHEFLEKCGSKPRLYKNGLALAIPAADQTESLRRDIRYFIAVDRVSKSANQHNLTKEQKDELRERKSTHESAAESAFVKLYPEVWLPKLDQGKIAVEKLSAGGRPLQATVNAKRMAMIFERSMELLTSVQSRVFSTLKPTKIVELFKLGEDQPPRLGIRCSEVVSGFYSFLGFTRLTNKEVVQKAIAAGIEKGDFGYFSGSVPTLDSAGKYQVARLKVRFNVHVSDDEVDLDSGFLMLPQSIPDEAATQAASAPIPPGTTQSHDEPTPSPEPVAGPGPKAATEKVFQVSFTADRDKLYSAWNAVANLADIAGKVEVSLRAESETGFDQSKLQNGVMEPLREADLIE